MTVAFPVSFAVQQTVLISNQAFGIKSSVRKDIQTKSASRIFVQCCKS